MPKNAEKHEANRTVEEVNAIIRLIDHCKRQGVAYFEGLNGVKFGIRAERRENPRQLLEELPNSGFIP